MTTVATKTSTPTLTEALNDINVRLITQNKFVPALTELMVLAKDHVTSAKLWLFIGVVYTRMSNWSDAIGALQTAIALDPQEHVARRLMALAAFSIGKREEACQMIEEACKRSSESGVWLLRAYILAHSHKDSALALRVAQDWGRRFADPLTRKAKPLKILDRSPRKKLKIGYVTGDFREHSVAFFMLPVLRFHNHEDYEIHVYSNGPWDHFTPQLRMLVHHWQDVMELSDAALHQRIRTDDIDILVDLSGFTHGHRLEVFARRAAPVQVTWLGYMHTLGMKAMDYRLVDAAIASPQQVPYYSECLFYLRCMVSYSPPAYAPLCEEPPMLRNGYPTLISLNSSAKLTDAMLQVWARILHAREDARLIIMVKELDADSAQAHMQPRVAAAGMPLERVSVLHQQPLTQFMELGHIADVMLDTAPVSGGTTTLHALWMGLSIVTMDGVRGVDASTAATLRGLRFGGEIVQDEEAYVQAALRLMDDPERLAQQRLVARAKMESSPLMNYPVRVAELEQAYRLMWLNYLQGRRCALSTAVDPDTLLVEMDASV